MGVAYLCCTLPTSESGRALATEVRTAWSAGRAKASDEPPSARDAKQMLRRCAIMGGNGMIVCRGRARDSGKEEVKRRTAYPLARIYAYSTRVWRPREMGETAEQPRPGW